MLYNGIKKLAKPELQIGKKTQNSGPTGVWRPFKTVSDTGRPKIEQYDNKTATEKIHFCVCTGRSVQIGVGQEVQKPYSIQ